MDFLKDAASQAAAAAKAGAEQAAAAAKAQASKIDLEGSMAKMSAAVEKVESAALGGTPMKSPAAAGGPRTLESLGRDELLLVAQRELKRSKELKAGLEGEGLWRDDVAHAGAAH